jgi:hypothetical protein
MCAFLLAELIMNDAVATGIVAIASLVSLICFVLVVIEMLQRGAVAMAVTCILLSLCCFLGGFIAFVYGWTRAGDWNIATVMKVWTVAFIVDLLAGLINPAPWHAVQRLFQP